MNTKIIFGFSGLMASGKGTAAKYLEENYHAETFRFSTILRAVLDRLFLEHSRDNLIKLSEVLRGTFGEDLLAKVIARDAEASSHKLVVVEGIRRLADIAYLQQIPGFILVEIAADIDVRYQRIIERRENPDDATKTFEQFLKDHERSTEISIPEVIAKATERIDNNGSLEELHRQLDTLVKTYLSAS